MLKPNLALPLFVLLLLLQGCSSCSSTPPGGNTGDPKKNCTQNTDCPADQRCTKNGCEVGCRSDTDCPDRGLCQASDGKCIARPQCVIDTDCKAGFQCRNGACSCTTDYACWTANGGTPDTTQICVQGACQTSAACTADNQCQGGRYCGPAGVCSAPCLQDTDCGGTGQTGALRCADGRCTSPCVNDTLPVGQGGCKDGQICVSGLCQVAQCATFADCGDPTLLCTDAKHGHCVPFSTCNVNDADSCGPSANCQRYDPTQCPPGFDCAKTVCVDLQGWLAARFGGGGIHGWHADVVHGHDWHAGLAGGGRAEQGGETLDVQFLRDREVLEGGVREPERPAQQLAVESLFLKQARDHRGADIGHVVIHLVRHEPEFLEGQPLGDLLHALRALPEESRVLWTSQRVLHQQRHDSIRELSCLWCVSLNAIA